MSEAELHIDPRPARRRHPKQKRARGELGRGLPGGFVFGEQDGEVLFHLDEAITAVRTVFERFAEFGSARRASGSRLAILHRKALQRWI
jgi:hypothetical protein